MRPHVWLLATLAAMFLHCAEIIAVWLDALVAFTKRLLGRRFVLACEGTHGMPVYYLRVIAAGRQEWQPGRAQATVFGWWNVAAWLAALDNRSHAGKRAWRERA